MSSIQLDYERRRPCEPLCSGRQEWYRALKHFEKTPRTEAAFYIRFQTLSPVDKKVLLAFYELEDDWKLFRKICRYYAVKREAVPAETRGVA
ncbi:MAG: hypothetical protein JSW66_10735 [Phycisphaerales bacterium]|nr:MAG: hypothetical protein JSW66_10735 [Phycisphaerales bacterium]